MGDTRREMTYIVAIGESEGEKHPSMSLLYIRPKKKEFVCPFPTDPKNWKITVTFFCLFFLRKKKLTTPN